MSHLNLFFKNEALFTNSLKQKYHPIPLQTYSKMTLCFGFHVLSLIYGTVTKNRLYEKHHWIPSYGCFGVNNTLKTCVVDRNAPW